jgi:hypothetical protein
MNTNDNTLSIKQSLAIRLIGSRQDHAAQGSYTSAIIQTRWSVLFDGHGDNHAIDFIRKAPLDEIMKNEDPSIVLHTLILEDESEFYDIKVHSGSTMVWVKESQWPDHRTIQIGNVGDSQAILFVNDKVVFISKRHDMTNPSELSRLFSLNLLDSTTPIIKNYTAFDVITEDSLLSLDAYYLNFDNKRGDKTQLACSQSIGHQDLTGISPDITTFKLKLTDSFRVVLLSDGITDIMPLELSSTMELLRTATDPKEIANEAERRWKQNWTIVNENNRSKTTPGRFPKDGYDDCACALMVGTPLSNPDEEELFTFDAEIRPASV